MANVTDLQSKYSKLAQEYSKAVLDEQTSSNSLKDELKQKEQSLRKVEQEMDSLSFRNQQLTKRVELLQEELLLSESKSKRSRNKGDSPPQVNLQAQSVFDEDLQKKIQENERLHIQFYEADEQFRRQEAQLRSRLDQLEKESEQHQAVVDALTSKYTDTIEKLQSDKARLEVKAQTLEREAKDCRVRTEECQQQLRKYQTEVSSQLKHSSSVIQEKVPFNDTQLSDFNCLNVPLHNRRHQLKARDVAAQALGFVQNLVAALLNFHSYTEQRVHIYPLDSSIEAISPVNQKFSQYLHENASYLRPLEEDLLQLHKSITEDAITVLETLAKLQDFSRSFSAYSSFLQKILPYQLKSLEEECDASLCTAALTARNHQLQNDMKKLTAVFHKLKSYVALLAVPSVRSDAMCQSSATAVFTQMSASLHGLHDVSTELSKHYSQKVSLEQDLPTATQKFRTTNECLLSSLASLTNSCGKVFTAPLLSHLYTPAVLLFIHCDLYFTQMATFFSNNLDFFASCPGYGPRGGVVNPLQADSVIENKRRAATYMSAIRKVRPESVPYREALANRHILTSSTESREGLMQQVVQSQEKISRLEQEKEHWLLEAQLGQVRLQKESQRIAQLEAQIAAGAPEEQHSAADGSDAARTDSPEPVQDSSLVGILTITSCSESAADQESREHLIKTHYMSRVSDLTSQLQMCDSKAVHFHAECRAVAKRLAIAEKSRETMTEELKLANQNITRLQDELSTTKRSYEDQLSMMSDHLCSMNDTLSKQRDEIDTLKLASKRLWKVTGARSRPSLTRNAMAVIDKPEGQSFTR
ncbi:Protein phosphatase 1 regulatory subunit 21 [Anabarilius grahami]|uniref:Protein phosphatase 1 regulatory subunit 21 n=1 Tax=Anabarilius grahami TaxID=495550 RepID=A0A3N0XV47_ANAGA|nr:Protein phosphatase 1 regulatory subunit 21 [Anabarilius grahami]